MNRMAIAALLALALGLPLRAAEICSGDPTIAKCQTEVANQAQMDAAEGGTKRALQAKPTGPDSVGSVASSSVKDFVPPLDAIIQSANLDQKNQQLTLDFNVTSLGAPKLLAVQLQSVIRQPQLYQPVKDALSATRAQQLQGGINDAGDISAVLTLGLQNDSFGRRLRPNDPTFTRLFGAIVKVSPDELNALQKPCNKLLADLLAAKHAIRPIAGNDPKFSDFAPADQAKLRTVCIDSARKLGAKQAAKAQALQDDKIADFADLLNNQQQLVLSGSRRFKNNLVGPDETAVQLSYEWSPDSLSSHRSDLQATKDDALVTTFENISTAAKRAGRLKASAQYTWIDRYSLMRSADGLDLLRPTAHRFTGSVTWGQPLLFDSEGNHSGQLDVTGQYDNFSDDPAHKDRLVASVTYTQKLTDSFSLPIGFTYANHSEFLTDVQTRFSAHFGLKLKLPLSGGS